MRKFLSYLMVGAILLAFFPFNQQFYVELALAVIALLVLGRGLAKQTIFFRNIVTPYSILLILLLCWSSFSIYWVPDRLSWLLANGILFISIVFTLVLSELIRLDWFRQTLNILIICIILIQHMVAWYDMYHYFYGWIDEFADFEFYGEMTLFYNVNDFALLCLFGFVYIMSLSSTKENFKQKGRNNIIEKKMGPLARTIEILRDSRAHFLRGFKLLIAISSLLLIYCVNARGILFAAIYAIFFYYILSIKRHKLRRLAVGIILALSALTIFLLYTDIKTILWEDGSFVIRYNLIRNGWYHLRESYFIGVGAGNSEYYMEFFNYYDTGGYVAMHNWWMEIIVEYGVFISSLYNLYYVRVFLSAYILSIKFGSQIGKWVATWLLGFIVAGFIPNTLFNFVWFWFIHNFVFVWFEYRLSTMELTDRALGLESKLNYKLNQFSEWLERKLVKE